MSQASSFFSFIYPRAYMKRDNGNEANIELDIYTSIIKFLSKRNTRQMEEYKWHPSEFLLRENEEKWIA